MTAQRHRAAAIMLRSRYKTVVSGLVDPVRTPYWGYEIWPALARVHDQLAEKIDLSLAKTAEIEAIIDSSLTS